MENGTAHTILTILVILVGFWFSIFHKRVGQRVANFNYKIFNQKYNVRFVQIFVLLMGIFFLILGFLGVFGIIKPG